MGSMLGSDRDVEHQFLGNIDFQIVEIRENPCPGCLQSRQGGLDELRLPASTAERHDIGTKGTL